MTGAPLQRPSKAQFAAAALAMAMVVLASNILVQFPINDWLTWGAITYPFAFLVTDVMNRVYGVQAARRVVFAGFVVGVVCSLMLQAGGVGSSSGDHAKAEAPCKGIGLVCH